MKITSRWLTIGLLTNLIAQTSASAMAAPPYSAQIRPGFMTGNNDVGNDANLDILVPLWGDERSMLFFNPNLRIDDNDGNEQNIGFGFRQKSTDNQFILGGNLFYDTMRSENDERYKQWGVGAELLSHWLDLRANYYDAFGDTENIIGGNAVTDAYYFSGYSLLASSGLQVERALDGFDAEASVLVPGISDIMETRLAATYYNFDINGGDNPKGWRGRLEMRPVKAVNLSVEYRDDDLRGNDTFIGGYVEIPFSMENLLAGKNPFAGTRDLFTFGQGTRQLKERMTDKVIRDRHIVTAATETQGGSGQTVVDNQMIFVNQDNPNSGDGSYENPYQTLGEAEADETRFLPGAWIYVFSSDETADTYAGISEFTMLNDMVFWGQGYVHPVYGLGGGNNPILEGNGGDNILHLANNNEVMGFTIQNGWNGISGSQTRAANIHDNIIRSNGRSGVTIYNSWSPADIDGKTLTFRFADNQILDNDGDGIYVRNYLGGVGKVEDSSITNTFTNNTLQGNSRAGIDSYTRVSLSDTGSFIADSSFTNTFSGNTVGGSEEGQGNGYHGLVSLIELSTQSDSSPISNTSLTSRYENNSVMNNDGYGINDDYLTAYTSGADSGLSNVSISRYVTDNVILDNSQSGFDQEETRLMTEGPNSPITDSSITGQIDRNTISDNGDTAMDYRSTYIRTTGTGSPISRSTISNAFRSNRLNVTGEGEEWNDGIHFYTTNILSQGSGSGLTDVSIDNIFTSNIIDGAETADDGIEIEENTYIVALQTDSPIANARISNTFEGNMITNFTGDGLYFPGNYIRTGTLYPYPNGSGTGSPISGSTINNTLTDNIVTDNGGYGIYNWRNEIGLYDDTYVATVSGSSTNNTYTGNTVTGNSDTGIYLDEDFDGGANTGMHYAFINNTISNNGGEGLYLYIDPSDGELINKTLFLQGNTITGNTGHGVEVYVNGNDGTDFKGDFGGGLLGSTGGNTFADNDRYDINHRGNSDMDIWALSNSWTDNNDPESTICDEADIFCSGNIITSLPQP